MAAPGPGSEDKAMRRRCRPGIREGTLRLILFPLRLVMMDRIQLRQQDSDGASHVNVVPPNVERVSGCPFSGDKSVNDLNI